MSLFSRNVYIVKNDRMILGFTKARPLTVLAFKHRQHAEVVRKIIKKREGSLKKSLKITEGGLQKSKK